MDEKLVNQNGQKKIKDYAGKFTSENKGTSIGARQLFDWHTENNAS